MSKVGRIVISYELLESFLGMVATGNSIAAVVPQTAEDVVNRSIGFVVQGPSMPEHPEGAHIQIVDWSASNAP